MFVICMCMHVPLLVQHQKLSCQDKIMTQATTFVAYYL